MSHLLYLFFKPYVSYLIFLYSISQSLIVLGAEPPDRIPAGRGQLGTHPRGHDWFSIMCCGAFWRSGCGEVSRLFQGCVLHRFFLFSGFSRLRLLNGKNLDLLWGVIWKGDDVKLWMKRSSSGFLASLAGLLAAGCYEAYKIVSVVPYAFEGLPGLRRNPMAASEDDHQPNQPGRPGHCATTRPRSRAAKSGNVKAVGDLVNSENR